MGTSKGYERFLGGGGHWPAYCPACGHLLDIDGDRLFCIANNHNREAKPKKHVVELEEALTEQMRLSNVNGPLMRYHGGKWRLAGWIMKHFPIHRIYVEPYGGAASVLLRKPQSYAEVYNDLDGEIVNVFRVLRNPAQARELLRLIDLTPFSRNEFELSYMSADDPIEQARRTLFRAMAGFGAAATGQWRTGFRSNVTRSGTTPARSWSNQTNNLTLIIERLRGVVIEEMPAVNLIEKYDTPDTLFYVDPPYVYETRSTQHASHAYRHEMSNIDHYRLAEVLHNVTGMVVISGYSCELYDEELYPDWHRVEKQSYADGGRARTEVLWINSAARFNSLPLLAALEEAQ